MKNVELKNTVTLKNFQSNIIEEATIVFKKNVKVPKYDLENKEKEFPIIEAEELINNYALKKGSQKRKKIEKYKVYTCIAISIIIIQNIFMYLK